MKFKLAHIILLVAFFVINVVNAQVPKLFLVDANKVVKIKKDAYSNDAIKKNVFQLTKNADKLLDKHFGSVMDKKFPPPCGNMHEYMSLAPYFWPDPSKPDGKPYIRKDGERNPERKVIPDDQNFDELMAAIHELSWAYYFSDDEKYATKATQIIRMWFLDTATMMLPNLNHAQIISGVDTGRGIGVIDAHELPKVIDGIGLLRFSKSWTKQDEEGITKWLNQYLNWLLTSKNGVDESKTKNNHKNFYDVQVLSLALFCNNTKVVDEILSHTQSRINAQIEVDGKQPLELERTLALGYSTFSLEAWFAIATMAEKRNVDLWSYQSADGRSLKQAIDYLLPYVLGEKKWEYQQIKEYKPNAFYSLLLQAAIKFKDNSYITKAEAIKSSNKNVFVKLFYE